MNRLCTLYELVIHPIWTSYPPYMNKLSTLYEQVNHPIWTSYPPYMYRKSHERDCISWFMGTSDVLKVFKIARAVGECNLKTFKTSQVHNHKSQNARAVHAIFCLLYSQQNHSVTLVCKPWVHSTWNTFQWFPKCPHVSFELQLQ